MDDQDLIVPMETKDDDLSQLSIELPVLSFRSHASHEIGEVIHINESLLGNRAIIISNLLSVEECEAMVNLIESRNRPPGDVHDLTLVPANSKPEYRNCLRICAHSDAVAALLYHRVLPVLERLQECTKPCNSETSSQFLENGMGMQGTWEVHGVNHFFRLCKYDAGGHFGPHYDSDYVLDPLKLRSLKTLMIYLNDDYCDGETQFCHDHSLHYDAERKLFCSAPGMVHSSWKARRGDCILFDHKLLHEGNVVTNGSKYIMRSEVMYHKQSQPAELMSEEEQRFQQAMQLWFEGSRLEGSGEVTEAVNTKAAYRLVPDLDSRLTG